MPFLQRRRMPSLAAAAAAAACVAAALALTPTPAQSQKPTVAEADEWSKLYEANETVAPYSLAVAPLH